MSQAYFYTIITAFPNSSVNIEKLTDEIEAVIISPVLESITSYPVPYFDPYLEGECEIIFASALSGPQQTTLDGIVAAHDGIPYDTHEWLYGDDLETRIRSDFLILHLTDSDNDPYVWGVHDARYANLAHDHDDVYALIEHLHDISDITGISVQADDGFEYEADPYNAGDIQTTCKPIFVFDDDGDCMPTTNGDCHQEFEIDVQGDITTKL
jgi:hypothetical protein